MNCVFSEIAAKSKGVDGKERGQIGVKTNLSFSVVQSSEISNNFMNDVYEIVMFIDRNENYLPSFFKTCNNK